MKLPPVGLVMVSAALACNPTSIRTPPAETAAAAQSSASAAHAPRSPQESRSPKVQLKGYVLDLLEPAPPVPAELDVPPVPKKNHAAKLPLKWIVQFHGAIGAEHQRELAALGARALEYVPDHAVIVSMDDPAASRVRGLGTVRGAARLRPAYKIDPGLKDDGGKVAPWDGNRRLAVRFDEADGFDAAAAEVHRNRGAVVDVSRGVLTANVPSHAVARLARLESVTWIEAVPEVRLLNDTTSWTIQTFRPNDRKIR